MADISPPSSVVPSLKTSTEIYPILIEDAIVWNVKRGGESKTFFIIYCQPILN